jgi:acetamidase/formamidase
MSATCKKQSFHVNQSQCHIRWDNSLTPVLTVESGSEISLDMKDGSNNQIHANSTIQDVIDFDTNIADPAFGPVYVNGAEPGDVLKVEFLDLKCGTSGWTAVMEGFGVLAEDFPEPQLKLWDLSEEQQAKGYAVFKKGIHIPLRPFLGVVGVAPAEDGEFLTVVPL